MSMKGLQNPGAQGHHQKGQIYATGKLSGTTEWPGESDIPESFRHYLVPRLSQKHVSPWQRNKAWQFLAVAGLVIVVGVVGMVLYLNVAFAGRIYPHVSIQGVPVGRMTNDEAARAIQTHYATFLSQPLKLHYYDYIWQPTLQEIGIQVHTDAVVQQAFEIGRRNGLLGNLGEIAAVWVHGRDIPIKLTVDQPTMQQYMHMVAHDIEYPAIDSQLFIQGAMSDTMPSRQGRQVLVSATIQDMTAALQRLETQPVAVRTRPLLPLLDDAATQQAQEAIDNLLQGSIVLQAKEQEWEWTVEDLASMMHVQRVESKNGGDEIVVALDEEEIQHRIQAIADATSSGLIYPRLDWNGGDLKIIREGTPGWRVDEKHATAMVLEAATSKERVIDLPFYKVKPAITEENLDRLHIQDLLAIGRSDFTGSEDYRITNIIAGMNLLHGILVAPGEEFSFNRSIGSIGEESGFVEGYAIINKRTQLEWGGGICQDSTTMFRAAFWAGLPITERWGHSFYINWYDRYGYGQYGDGSGMDATIFIAPGGPDLKFLNDTGHWLLIQTGVDVWSATAEVRIYGTDIGRTVELEGPEITNRTPAPERAVYVSNPDRSRRSPKRTDTARGGMDIYFTRIIKEQGVEAKREQFVTSFKPWPDIYEVHPDDLDYYNYFEDHPEGFPAAASSTETTTPESAGDTAETEGTPQPATAAQTTPQPAMSSDNTNAAPTPGLHMMPEPTAPPAPPAPPEQQPTAPPAPPEQQPTAPPAPLEQPPEAPMWATPEPAAPILPEIPEPPPLAP